MPVKTDLLALVAAVGLPLTALLWFVTRRTVRHSRLGRLAVCTLAAISLTPTACAVCGTRTLLPAIFISLNSLSTDSETRFIGLVYGVLPIVTVAALAFSVWSYYAERHRAAYNGDRANSPSPFRFDALLSSDVAGFVRQRLPGLSLTSDR